ncbi:unnamed protein product, partial [Didymodactylos carnosus]
IDLYKVEPCTITHLGNTSKAANVVKSKIDISKIKVWNYDDITLPKFDENNAVIAKWTIFKVSES